MSENKIVSVFKVFEMEHDILKQSSTFYQDYSTKKHALDEIQKWSKTLIQYTIMEFIEKV